jgi:hypothetical protein
VRLGPLLARRAVTARARRIKMKQSDGECLINSSGGCGIMGTFGDTSKAAVTGATECADALPRLSL